MVVYIKEQSLFPHIERYRKVFPVTDGTIFAYNNSIYTNYVLTKDLIVHEEAHLKRQNKIGLEKWVDQYLEDEDFRLKEEVIAYKAQLESIKDREHRNKVRIESIKTLTGGLYGLPLTKEEAFKLLK